MKIVYFLQDVWACARYAAREARIAWCRSWHLTRHDPNPDNCPF